MPLPKPPTKPATLLDTSELPRPRARATRRAASSPAAAAPADDPAVGTIAATPPSAATTVPVGPARPLAADAGVSVPEGSGAGLPPAVTNRGRGRRSGARVQAQASAAPAADVQAPAGVPMPVAGATAPPETGPGSGSTPGFIAAAPPAVAPSAEPSSAAPVRAAPGKVPAPTGPAARAERRQRPAPATPAGNRKLFVLDTNVLMHDPSSLFRFDEHDVFLPMTTLEELDNHKKGMSEVSRNVRQVSRSLDALIASVSGSIDDGVPLAALGNREAAGRLFFQTRASGANLPSSLPTGKADNQILGVVRELQDHFQGRDVVLVSKDINMRIKARTLALMAEDYRNDQVLEDTDLLYSGIAQLPADFWDTHGKGMASWQQAGVTCYRVSGPLVPTLMINQFVYIDGDGGLMAQVTELRGSTAVLQTLRDFSHPKNAVWGITARNREQNFALNLLMNPEIDFVSLLGQAGTGKTLLALAAGLSQAIEGKRYSEIIMTRATVPVGEDIGYLPGTEEEKMQPWMGALEDNLEVLNHGESGGDWGRAATNDLIRSRVKVKAMSFMRGRTFISKFLILDEAQNLTPKQMKTLITRAGPGTKVVCLGNIAQIDTPYLTEGSSGLTYVVDRFKGWAHAGHVTLQRGERSRLADFAGEAL